MADCNDGRTALARHQAARARARMGSCNALVYLADDGVKEHVAPQSCGGDQAMAISRRRDGRSVDEFHVDRSLDDPSLDPPGQELTNGAASSVAVVERPVVHIHSDEGVGLGSLETTSVLHRVVERRRSMIQSIRDTVAKML